MRKVYYYIVCGFCVILYMIPITTLLLICKPCEYIYKGGEWLFNHNPTEKWIMNLRDWLLKPIEEKTNGTTKEPNQ